MRFLKFLILNMIKILDIDLSFEQAPIECGFGSLHKYTKKIIQNFSPNQGENDVN